jgi:ureidoglycolate lyase
MAMEIVPQDLSAEAFAPFGAVIVAPSQAVDASGAGWKWWMTPALLPGTDRPYSVGYLDLWPAALQVDWAERHMHSAEMVIPVGGDCLVYVAPPDYPEEQVSQPQPDYFQVFVVHPGQAVILKAGVWHGAPLALTEPLSAIVLLLQHTGRDDTSLVRFTETPVTVSP